MIAAPTDGQLEALSRIARIGQVAWMPYADFLDEVGPAPADEIRAAELVEVWDRDRKGQPFEVAMVTLTTYAALLLGVEVRECRWRAARGDEGASPRAKPQRGQVDMPFVIEAVPSRGISPEDEAAIREAWGRLYRGEVAIDPATGNLVRADTPEGVAPEPITILNAPVRVTRPKRAG